MLVHWMNECDLEDRIIEGKDARHLALTAKSETIIVTPGLIRSMWQLFGQFGPASQPAP